MKLYEYVILYHPNRTKEQKESGEHAKSEILVDVTRILARDEKEVTLIAARSIPDKYIGSLDCVEVGVRPF